MKKSIFIFMILIITATAVFAQNIFDPRLLTQVGLSAEEIEEIQDIQFQTEQRIKANNAEINIIRAQLEKILLEQHPDMETVREMIEAAARWRSENEIANVEARVQIRQKMGSGRYEEMLRLRKKIQQRIQTNSATQNQVAPNAGTGSGNSGPRN